MILYQSFWSEPAKQMLSLRGNFILNVLSCCYAKAAGYVLNLHTDYIGKLLLDYLPYNNLYLDLDSIKSPFLILASAKVYAYLNEPMGSIHIDNDVFIYKYHDLSFSDYDLITLWGFRYCVDDDYFNTLKSNFKEIMDDSWYNNPYTFHCGFTGFNNKKLLLEFTDTFLKVALDYKNSEAIKIHTYDKGNLDCVLEEYLLAYKANGLKCKLVLPVNHNRASWVLHSIGPWKFEHLDALLFLVKLKFPEIYKLTIERLPLLDFHPKHNLRFVHSFWSKPYLNNSNLKQTIRLFAISAEYIKKFGGTIVLHTDSAGKNLLKDIKYDEVYTTLDSIPGYIHPRFYAYGKYVAMENEPLNSIHIDGDVSFKNGELLNTISNTNYDMIVLDSKFTVNPIFFVENRNLLKQHLLNCGMYNTSGNYYNTGIIGWKNQELKNKCITFYKKLVQNCCRDVNILECLDIEKEYLIPDLVAEQFVLFQLAKNYNVYEVIKYYWPQLLGYQHLLSSSKYSDSAIFNSIIELSNLNPDLSKKISNYDFE